MHVSMVGFLPGAILLVFSEGHREFPIGRFEVVGDFLFIRAFGGIGEPLPEHGLSGTLPEFGDVADDVLLEGDLGGGRADGREGGRAGGWVGGRRSARA